jgi:6,7-dimethyl-8-ribityllumazine synthase
MGCNTLNTKLDASSKRFAIVAGRFNSLFTDRLVDGAIEAILRHGGSEEDITIIKVPGCFEIPLTCQEAANSTKFDAIVAVGALIEGETDHYQLIASQVAAGIADVNRKYKIPTTFGVITAKNMEQATARSGAKVGNLGYEAAVAAIEMVNVLEALRS